MSGQGRFAWFELLTLDPAAAPSFYGPVAALATQKWPEEGMDYTMWVGATGPVGGLMTLPEQAKAMGAPPHWLGYVATASVAAAAERAASLGGKVLVPPTTIPNAGEFAIIADPQGAVFGVHSGGGDGGPPREPGLGSFGWCELATSDPDGAFTFYSQLFGWVKTTAMEMGPVMGNYQMFGQPGAPDIGGIMRTPNPSQGSAWIHYTQVADADAAYAKATELGAVTLYAPMDIPGGGRATLVIDPQGAVIGMFHAPKG